MEKSLINIIQTGGLLFVVLCICGVVSWILIIERILYFKKYDLNPLDVVKNIVSQKNLDLIVSNLDVSNPIVYVLLECANTVQKDKIDEQYFEEVKSRAITEKLPDIQRYLSIQATLGSVSPYLGLLGTIFGIIKAFVGMAKNSELTNNLASSNNLNLGISEALILTAAGLCVAIPATIAYNYFTKKVEILISNIEIAASYLKSHFLKHIKLK